MDGLAFEYICIYFTAIRSGDYYMFDDIDDEELDLIKEDEESLSEPDELDSKRFTMSKVRFSIKFNYFFGNVR